MLGAVVRPDTFFAAALMSGPMACCFLDFSGAWMNAVYRLGDDVSFEPVGEGAVILLLGSGQLYSCNDTSLSFLQHLDGVRDVEAVARRMADEFEIDAATLANDLPELIAGLVAEGIIVHAA